MARRLWCWSYKAASCLESYYRFWQWGKGRKGLIIKRSYQRKYVPWRNNSTVLPKTEGGPAAINPCVDTIQRKRDIQLNLHVRGGKRKEMLSVIRIATEHKPWEVMTDLKCFCMKGHRAEPRGTPMERSCAVERHPLCVSCKQQPSQQEVNLKHEDPEISLLQETGAYPVG